LSVDDLKRMPSVSRIVAGKITRHPTLIRLKL
jgi:hypothetical protein